MSESAVLLRFSLAVCGVFALVMLAAHTGLIYHGYHVPPVTVILCMWLFGSTLAGALFHGAWFFAANSYLVRHRQRNWIVSAIRLSVVGALAVSWLVMGW